MKVLYDDQVFSYQTHGGVSRYFAELITGLGDRGHEAARGWRFSPNQYLPGPDLFGSFRFKGKAAVREQVNRFVARRALAKTWDVFHPTYYDPYFLSALKGRPFVLTIHDMTHELFPETLPDADRVLVRKRLLAEKAARVIAVSENTKADAVRLLGLDPARVTVVPHGNGLRPGVVEPMTTEVSPPYWLYVGSRKEYKDFAVVVAALKIREAGRRGEGLVLVGGGALTTAEAKLLDEAGLAGRVLQTDCSEAELAGWYAGALALVYSSRYEGFGMPLLEAMAWGCPVVAARSSCLPEVGGAAALFFTPSDPLSLAVLLERVLDPMVRTGLVEAGRVREAEFTWDRAVEATLQVYREVGS